MKTGASPAEPSAVRPASRNQAKARASAPVGSRGHAVGQHEGLLQPAHHEHPFGKRQLKAALGRDEPQCQRRNIPGDNPKAVSVALLLIALPRTRPHRAPVRNR